MYSRSPLANPWEYASYAPATYAGVPATYAGVPATYAGLPANYAGVPIACNNVPSYGAPIYNGYPGYYWSIKINAQWQMYDQFYLVS